MNRKFSFSVNEEDDSAHICTIANVDANDFVGLKNRLQLALDDHFDEKVEIGNIPSNIFGYYSSSVDIKVNEDYKSSIRLDITYLY